MVTEKKTLLLIDDHEADNVYHGIILRRSDRVGDVVTMESGQAALYYLQNVAQRWPDLILVDVNMPGMDGFDVVRELERIGLPTHTRVAMLTSSDAKEDRDRACQLASISAYLVKPLVLTAIVHMLTE